MKGERFVRDQKRAKLERQERHLKLSANIGEAAIFIVLLVLLFVDLKPQQLLALMIFWAMVAIRGSIDRMHATIVRGEIDAL